MDTLLRETVNAVVNSRFPEMSIEGRRQIESILIREEYPKGVIALNEGEVAHELVFVGKDDRLFGIYIRGHATERDKQVVEIPSRLCRRLREQGHERLIHLYKPIFQMDSMSL